MQPPPLTDQVTYRGHDQPDVMVTVNPGHPDGLAAGEHYGNTRMAGKDEHGRWWRLVAWMHPGPHTRIDWFPDTHVRPATLDDMVGVVPAGVLGRMRTAAAQDLGVSSPSEDA
ncbi:hypothetical protein GCM10023339_41230 [Alloalcanivorax gelatiniphagus]